MRTDTGDHAGSAIPFSYYAPSNSGRFQLLSVEAILTVEA